MSFLSAEWRKLVLANYAVDPSILQALVPHGVELDSWNDTCYVSLVGFLFQNTRVLGLPIPFHRTFPEVNLRFYVRKQMSDGSYRRGVVFVREIVPLPAITLVANTLYKEHYATMPMRYGIHGRAGLRVRYEWKHQGFWNHLIVNAKDVAEAMPPGSEPEFITEHYWGYTRVGEDRTSEYEVRHPRWEVYPVGAYEICCQFGKLYGERFSFLEQATPVSVMLAEGSAITVEGRS
jgi:uncharacterized protein YqjF (DUF2071 family)